MRRAVLGDSGSGGGGEKEHRSHSNYVRKSRPVRAGLVSDSVRRRVQPAGASAKLAPRGAHRCYYGPRGQGAERRAGQPSRGLTPRSTHSLSHAYNYTVPVWRAVLARDLLAARRRAAPKPRGRPRWRSNELGDSRPRRHCRAGPCAVRPAAERIGCEAPIEERRDKTIKTAHHARGYALTAHGLEIVELLWRARVPG